MDSHHYAELARAALAMAVGVRGRKGGDRRGHHALRQGSEYTAKTFRATRDRMGANNIDMPRQSPTREPNAGAVVLAALHRETERSTQPAISAVRQGIQ